MASVFLKRGKYWARIKGDKEPGKWSSVPTGETDRDAAMRFAQRAIDKRNATPHGRATLHAWVARWMERRKLAVHDWRKEQGRLRTHCRGCWPAPRGGACLLTTHAEPQLPDFLLDSGGRK